MNAPLRIATRGSRLALWQANFVADKLRPIVAPRPVELIEIRTTGDQLRDAPLTAIGGQGAFTKEIQQSVLDGRADVAVHSLKDLPTELVPNLVLAAVPERGPTADVFISRRHKRFDDLPIGGKVATGSSRRRAQILYRRPDLQLTDIRGNVETRLRKLEEAGLDAIILAQAGLERLGLQEAITEVLDAWMLPAIGQGALGLECRADDRATYAILEGLNHPPSQQAVLAERAFLRTLGGGCLLPIAALAEVHSDELRLRGAVLSATGREKLHGEHAGRAESADIIGTALADRLLQEGAARLLRAGET